MITGDDIRRMEEEQAAKPHKLLIIDTMQFFEIEIPVDVDADYYVGTEECRKICADKILSQMTDLKLERIITDDS